MKNALLGAWKGGLLTHVALNSGGLKDRLAVYKIATDFLQIVIKMKTTTTTARWWKCMLSDSVKLSFEKKF